MNYPHQGMGKLVSLIFVFHHFWEDLELRLDGTGNIELTAREYLSVFLNGRGNVSYKGRPEIEQNVLGRGQVIDSN